MDDGCETGRESPLTDGTGKGILHVKLPLQPFRCFHLLDLPSYLPYLFSISHSSFLVLIDHHHIIFVAGICRCCLQFVEARYIHAITLFVPRAATVTTPSLYRPIHGYRFQLFVVGFHVPVQHFPGGILSCIFVAATSGHSNPNRVYSGVSNGWTTRCVHSLFFSSLGHAQPSRPDPAHTIRSSPKRSSCVMESTAGGTSRRLLLPETRTPRTYCVHEHPPPSRAASGP